MFVVICRLLFIILAFDLYTKIMDIKFTNFKDLIKVNCNRFCEILFLNSDHSYCDPITQQALSSIN